MRTTVAGMATGLAAILVAPGVTGAQAAPTLTVTPTRLDPGESYTVTVNDCAVEPEVHVGRSDMLVPLLLEATGTAGEWAGTVTAGDVDGDERIGGTCDGVELDGVLVDVDDPWLGLSPRGSLLPPDGTPTTAYGTDCPDGSTVTLVVTPEGAEPVTTSGIAIDERGDWQAGLPRYPSGTRVTVSASCGDVTFDEVSYVALSDIITTTTSTTTTTTVTPPARPPASPPPATPRPGSAAYTG